MIVAPEYLGFWSAKFGAAVSPGSFLILPLTGFTHANRRRGSADGNIRRKRCLAGSKHLFSRSDMDHATPWIGDVYGATNQRHPSPRPSAAAMAALTP